MKDKNNNILDVKVDKAVIEGMVNHSLNFAEWVGEFGIRVGYNKWKIKYELKDARFTTKQMYEKHQDKVKVDAGLTDGNCQLGNFLL